MNPMTLLRRLRALGENNLALKLFALAIATLLYFAVRPSPTRPAALAAARAATSSPAAKSATPPLTHSGQPAH